MLEGAIGPSAISVELAEVRCYRGWWRFLGCAIVKTSQWKLANGCGTWDFPVFFTARISFCLGELAIM
jgi:hypothetical protein